MDQKYTEGSHELEGACYSFGDNCRRTTHVDEAFNKRFDRDAIFLKPGDVYCLDDEHKMLVATLGSGIAITIYDQKLYFGVMAYSLMTPEICDAFPRLHEIDASVVKKAEEAMDKAVTEMKKRGAGKSRIRIRLFGGANLQQNEYDLGTKNYVFVKEYLERKGLHIMGEDIGGTEIRRVHFLPEKGTVTRFILNRESDYGTLRESELKYFKEQNS